MPILADDKVGNKGCEWLSMNMDRFDYMCVDVPLSAQRRATPATFRHTLAWASK
jgi:hypothetical protein